MPARGNQQQNQQQGQGQHQQGAISPLEYMKLLTQYITLAYKHVPKLEDVGFDTWHRKISETTRTLQIPKILMTPYGNGEQPGYDQSRETDHQRLGRDTLYSTISNSTGQKYQHLLEDVDEGDARHAFNVIQASFVSNDAGGCNKMRTKFNNSSMISDQVNILEFISLISKRAKDCNRFGENIQDRQKISVLLEGLSDEFKDEKAHYERKQMSELTWTTVVKGLKQFANNKDLMDFTPGVGKTRRGDKAFITSQRSRNNSGNGSGPRRDTSKIECKFHKKGRCDKGKDCPFKHSKQTRRCNYCNKDNHEEERCFKKKRDEEKKKEAENHRKEIASIASEVFKQQIQLGVSGIDSGEESYMVKEIPDLDSDSDEEIPDLGGDGKSDNESGSENNSEGNSNYMVQVQANNEARHGQDNSTLWAADSACTRHVTNDEHDYIPGTVRQVHIDVDTGKGHTVCKMIGDIAVRDKDIGKNFLMRGVMFLPGSPKKLFSELVMDRMGCSITKPGNGTCTFKNEKTGEVVTTARIDNRYSKLYICQNLVVRKLNEEQAANYIKKKLQKKKKIGSSTNDTCATTIAKGDDKNQNFIQNLVQGKSNHRKQHKNETVDAAMRRAKSGQLAQSQTTTVGEAMKLLQLHHKYCHANFNLVRSMEGLPASNDNPVCDQCAMAKANWSSMPSESSKPRAERVLYRMHMDICFGRGSRLIWQMYVDDKSRKIFGDKLTQKNDALQACAALERKLENERSPLRIAIHTTDDEPLYDAAQWKNYRAKKGIQHETNGPYRKESVLERAARTVGEGARAMMLFGNAPEDDHWDAVRHKMVCMNMTKHSAHKGHLRTPNEVWYGVKLKPSNRLKMGIFACLVYVNIHKDALNSKFDPRAYPSAYLGLHPNARGFRHRDLRTGVKKWGTTGTFITSVFPYRSSLPRMPIVDLELDDITPEVYNDSKKEALRHWTQNLLDAKRSELTIKDNAKQDETKHAHEESKHDDEKSETAAQQERKTKRQSKPARPRAAEMTNITDNITDKAYLITRSSPDPADWNEAMESEDAEDWIKAGEVEINNHITNGTWKLVDRAEALASGARIFHPRTVFKRKWLPPSLEYPNGRIEKHKVRITIAAYKRMLTNGVDYREKYAHTPRWSTVRILLALAAYYKMPLSLDDIIAFFLVPNLEPGECIYMEQPERYSDGTDRLCKLLKSMYGLPQASNHAQRKLIKSFLKRGYKQLVNDQAAFVKNKEGERTIVVTHVDDNLSAGNIEDLRATLKGAFKITSQDEPKLVTGVQIERNIEKGWLKIHQEGYILKLLEREQMLDSKPSATPIDKSLLAEPRSKNRETNEETKKANKHFQKIFGELLWLRLHTREDLAFTCSFFSRWLTIAGPRELKWIRDKPLRYLNGTRKQGLAFYSKTEPKLTGASDSDFAGDIPTSRSTLGHYLKFGDYGIISSASILDRKVHSSVGQAETAAAVEWTKEQHSAKLKLREMGENIDYPIECKIDNDGVRKQAANPITPARAKHYRVNQAILRQLQDDREIDLVRVDGADNPADFYTKPLPKSSFVKHRDYLMGPQECPE